MTHRLGPKHGMLASQTCPPFFQFTTMMSSSRSSKANAFPDPFAHTGHSQPATHMRTNWRLSPAGLVP